MAYFVDYALTFGAAGAGTNVVANMPRHQTNDILVAYAVMNAGALTTSTAGWATVNNNATNASNTSSWTWKRAAGSTETFTFSTADDYSLAIFCIRDADTSANVIDTSSHLGSTTSTSKPSSATVTPTANDCFILYCIGVDGVGTATHSDPGFHHIVSADNSGGNAGAATTIAACWTIHRAGGTATPAATWTASLAGTSARLTLAIRNATGGAIPAYIDTIDEPIPLVAGHHFSALNNISFAGALTLNNIGPGGTGKTTTFDAAAATADFGINPYSAALASTPGTTAATAVAGFEVSLSPTVDLTGKFVLGTAIASSPRNANFTTGTVGQGGIFFVVGSTGTNTNYRSYQVLASDSVPNPEGRAVFSVNPNQTTTAFGTNGSATMTAISKLLFLSNCPTGANTLYTCDWYAVTKLVIAGGNTVNPVNTSGVVNIGSSFRIKAVQQSGASGVLSYVPLQIGGSDAVYFDIEGGALQFPRIYSTATREINFHAAVNTIGISYAGKSGDTIKHTNSVITSPSSYYWEINSAATSAATWDFSGLVIVGAAVTLRNVMMFDSMTFNTFTSINASGCTLTNCTFTEPPATTNSLTVSGTSSFSGCLFNTTTITAGNSLVSIGNPAIFSNSTFTGSSTSGHAIRITTPGTYSLVGLNFNGYGGTIGSNLVANSGSTSAAIFNDSGGVVTLQVSGATLPSVRNGVGATTNVTASYLLTITNIVQGTQVTIVNSSTRAELQNSIAPANGIVTYSHSGGETVDILLINLAYDPNLASIYDLTLPSANSEIKVQMIDDVNYSNP